MTLNPALAARRRLHRRQYLAREIPAALARQFPLLMAAALILMVSVAAAG